ncbi:hypothetical protein D3C85_1340270 [compost metagenome]
MPWPRHSHTLPLFSAYPAWEYMEARRPAEATDYQANQESSIEAGIAPSTSGRNPRALAGDVVRGDGAYFTTDLHRDTGKDA